MRNWLRQVVENERVGGTDAPLGVIYPFDGNRRVNPPRDNDSNSFRIQVIDSKWEDGLPEIRWHLVPEDRQPLRLILDARLSR
jgi:hypothetical protein